MKYIGGGISENNEPLYVIRIDPLQNRVIVGTKEALARDIIMIEDCNWLGDLKVGKQYEIGLKFRSVMNPISAFLTLGSEDGKAVITLPNAQYGIAPGQAAVCYDGAKVLGGGWIYATDNSVIPIAA